MSDMQKWLKLMESVPPVIATPPTAKNFERDATVSISPEKGGGTGRFIEFTEEDTALIDIKGVARELQSDSFSQLGRDLGNGNDWDHMSVVAQTPGRQNDKPEFRPGDMVKVADVYGAVIGPGFGVFVGYGTTGKDCIILFDGKQIVVPVENIASVLEQDAKDNFDEVDNDGNLSPMSFGSENVKIEQEPAMDHRDEFTRWMEAVEEALTSEGKEIAEDVPPVANECGCGSWDCTICFPSQDEMPGMHGAMDGLGGLDTSCQVVDSPEICAACGHALDDGHQHEPNVVSGGIELGLEEVDSDMGDIDDLMQSPMEETPQQVEQMPRSKDGRGVKLGDIVQKTEYRKVGQESPLTYGDDNLGEASYEDDDEFDFTDLGHYEPRPHEIFDPSIDDPTGYKAFQDEMRDGPKTQEDVEEAANMIEVIMNLQRDGSSNAVQNYTEDQLTNIGLPQLRQIYAEVTGNNGVINMENIDKDVAAMLETLKKYDQKLTESVAPVLEKKSKPDFLDVDSDGDKKEPWKKAEKDKEEKSEIDEGVDPEVLDWMKRFARLGNIKGYGH